MADAKPTKDLSLVIPVYNEEENLRPLADEIRQALTSEGLDYEVIFIDDGSSDDTVGVAVRLGVEHIVRLPGHKGLAVAFQTGLDACLKLGADIIVNTDGDNQFIHPLSDHHQKQYGKDLSRKAHHDIHSPHNEIPNFSSVECGKHPRKTTDYHSDHDGADPDCQ